MESSQAVPSEPPAKAMPRFEIELEFVSSLANPAYLQYLAVTYPNLLNPSETAAKSATKKKGKDEDNSDSTCFARYLEYLLYWRNPEYAQYLTHPAATIRNLELLQNERFRRDIARPDVIARLAEGFQGVAEYVPLEQQQMQTQEGTNEGEVAHDEGFTRSGAGIDSSAPKAAISSN